MAPFDKSKRRQPTGPGPDVIWLMMAVLQRSIPFLAVADCVRQEKRPILFPSVCAFPAQVGSVSALLPLRLCLQVMLLFVFLKGYRTQWLQQQTQAAGTIEVPLEGPREL